MPHGPFNFTQILFQKHQEPFNSSAAYANTDVEGADLPEPSLVTDQTRLFRDIGANICRRYSQSLSVLEV